MPEDPDTTFDDYVVPDEQPLSRLLPHSADAEKAVLACVMNDPNTWDQLAGLIESEDFYETRNRKIFEVMQSLANQGNPTDHLSVSDALANADQLKAVGDYPYLFDVTKTIHDPHNVQTYARMVHDAALRRDLVGAADFIKNIAVTPGERSTQDVLSESETRVLGISAQKTDERFEHSLGEDLTKIVQRIEQMRNTGSALPGLASGFLKLDELTGGLHDNDLIIVAGRPSMGKTSFAINISENVILREKPSPVLFFSLEQDASQIMIRMLSSLSGVPYNKLERAELSVQQWKQLESAYQLLSDKQFHIVSRPTLSVDEMRSYLRRINRMIRVDRTNNTSQGIGLVVVDYIQLMRASRRIDSRVLELGDISRSLKAFAKEFEVPVIALAQLNRAVESRNDKRPRMADLRDSGEIEQDADLIVFIYRDEVYDEQSPHKGKAEIIVAKQRNGPRGSTELSFSGALMKFENPGEESAGVYQSAQPSRDSDAPPSAPSFEEDDSPPF